MDATKTVRRKDGASVRSGGGVARATAALLGVVLALWAVPGAHAAISLQDMVRLEGYGKSELWGIGLVVGLPGTGDSGEFLPMARQLARAMERSGHGPGLLAELGEANSVAMVMVTAPLPAFGVKKGDEVDAHVSVLNTASSLEGGRLFLTALQGPLPGQGVYAMASGRIHVSDDAPTAGTVSFGARLIENVNKPVITDRGRVTLNILPRYASWTTAELIASTINQDKQGLMASGDERRLARARDERTVVVEIPDADLADPGAFIASMQTITFDETLLKLPARVVINRDAGSIVLTGNVRVSPAVVSHRELTVTTVVPEIEPVPEAPRLDVDSSVAIASETSDERGLGMAQDLLNLMRRLDVPVDDQIEIIEQLHAAGNLHAELIIE